MVVRRFSHDGFTGYHPRLAPQPCRREKTNIISIDYYNYNR